MTFYNDTSNQTEMRTKNCIPFRKLGKYLYFFYDEIFNWIDEGI